ncbi:anhydro-N-acetylmuramic acid kinase [Georgenia soli]|uniref:Anhydro-N-acetylmuramic acid kinase n=1 Tax=Georgenia soli TaxID=638953 RepID=A0A2A9ERQ7_9MICO|nr:anhydro-N-acetylmuramic acid kinase [Georgenia soli]PFG40950.1 anhydro-N-acetylmuramic acid kinase [Georgenia soli]
MKVLGMISGTSHDGIDVAVVDFSPADGDPTALTGTVSHVSTVPYDPGLRTRLLRALPPRGTTLAEVCELDTAVGQAFAEAAVRTVATAGPVDLICSHGQTVYHWVQAQQAHGTLQIGQPAWIAEATGTPVVADVRARDVAAGGHGAPLVSFMDTLLLTGRPGVWAALNLGGISNMTVVGAPAEPVAYDIGPANALLDAAVLQRQAHPTGFDVDGAIAAAGRVDEELLGLLLREDYYVLPAPKSTGKELFHDRYLSDVLTLLARDVTTPDLLATLTELTAVTVAEQVQAHAVDHVMISGGGAANPTMLRRLTARLPGVELITSAELGAPPDAKEAIAFALTGWCTAHGVAATVPSATGARGPRVLGAVIPGDGPLRLPEPSAHGPRSLRLRSGERGGSGG